MVEMNDWKCVFSLEWKQGVCDEWWKWSWPEWCCGMHRMVKMWNRDVNEAHDDLRQWFQMHIKNSISDVNFFKKYNVLFPHLARKHKTVSEDPTLAFRLDFSTIITIHSNRPTAQSQNCRHEKPHTIFDSY